MSVLLISQLVGLVLVVGLAAKSLDHLADILLREPLPRALVLAGLSLSVVFARETFRRALCPSAITSLSRQPLGDGAFALLVLPCTLPLAWPWTLIAWIADLASPGFVVAASLAGTLTIAGAAGSVGFAALASWTCVPLALLLAADRYPSLVWPTAFVLATAGMKLAGRSLREGSTRTPAGESFPTWRVDVSRRRRGGRIRRTPLAALVGLDIDRLRPQALPLILSWALPALCIGYLLVLRENGNCGASCTKGAALSIAMSGALPSLLVMTILQSRYGARRLLVPDRVVSTRLRLIGLAIVLLTPFLPLVVVLTWLSGEAALVPHVVGVTSAVLLVQLLRLDRECDIGRVLWIVLPLTLALLLTSGTVRTVTGVVTAVVLVALVDRKAAVLRRTIMAGGWAESRG